MVQIAQRSSMLGLVRRTCHGADELPDFEGVYEPDPTQVKAWQEAEATNFGCKARFVNLPPGEVKRRLETATDSEEIEALKVAEGYWRKNRGYAGEFQAGTVDRGEPRQAIFARSMRELVSKERAAISVRGTLRGGGLPSGGTMGGDPNAGLEKLSAMIDWDCLMSMGPAPEPEHDEDWF